MVADREAARAIRRLESVDRSVDWITPTLSGAWVAFGGSEQAPAYSRTASGMVLLRGVAKSGTVPSTLFTLPAGFRPLGNRRFPVVANNLFGYISIIATGVVTIEAGSNVYVDLAAVSFRAEQ